jgi:glycosyltransferase involved in cell wall biosynthesis
MLKVSIVMPVYNTGEILRTTIEAILAQTFTEWELLLIDDGSSDNSGNICDEYATKDNRIKVFHKKNGGICDARNYGLEQATGEYIAFCDHDDKYHSNLLEKVLDVADRYSCDIVKYRYKSLSDKGASSKLPLWSNDIFYTDDISMNIMRLVRMNYFSTIWSCIYRKELIISLNEYFSMDFRHGGEDFDFNVRVFHYIKRMVILPDILYTHYMRESLSTSAGYYKDLYYLVIEEIVKINDLLVARGIEVKNVANDYLYFLAQKVKYAIAYGLKCGLNYTDICDVLEKIYASNMLKGTACQKELSNSLILSLLYKKQFRVLFLLGRIRVAVKTIFITHRKILRYSRKLKG